MDNPPSSAPGSNLLDRVLQSQQSVNLEHFDPLETVNELLKTITPKESDVLRRRFGLGPNESETLEVIGQSYKVTRERVRQIQHWAIQHIRQAAATAQMLHGLVVVLQQLLETHGGLMLEDELLVRLQGSNELTRPRQAATIFILEELLNERVAKVITPEVKPYWKLKLANTQLLAPIIKATASVLQQAGKPLSQSELLKQLRALPLIQQSAEQLTDEIIMSYVSVAKQIEKNPFNEIGLTSWGTIVPRRMHDKILLVMRKHGQPMHFKDIAKRINEIGFDHRQAYPPTVHNELILNKEYVLVGRGIYALQEWGYKPGVVADVIADIIRQAGRPLSREEIVDQVLAQRMVKKNTIHLALTNKSRFQRQADGRYSLTENKKI